MAKEVKIKITAENKGLLSSIASGIAGLKKFAVSVAGLENIKVSANGAAGAITDITSAANSAEGKIDALTKNVTTGMSKAAKGAKDTGDSIKGAGTSADGAGNKFKGAGDKGKTGFEGAKGSATAFGQTLANVTIIANGIVSVLNKLKDVFTSAVAPGYDYTKQMESARIGVAGILLSMTQLNGRQLELNEALAISEQTFDALQQRSLSFGLNISDTAAAFQAIVGPGLEAQMSLEQMVYFAVQGTKAVKSFGLDAQQVVQELRAMVSGDINQDSQIAKSMGITAAGVSEAKQTAGGLFNYLNEKLKGFTIVAGEIPKTFKGKSDMIAAAISIISSQGFEPLLASAKSVMDGIIGYITVTTTKTDELGNTTKKVEMNPELISTLQEVSEYLSTAATGASNFGRTMVSFLTPAVPLLKTIIKHTGIILTTLAGWVIAGTVIPILQKVAAAVMALGRVWIVLTTNIKLSTVATVGLTTATEGAAVAMGTFKLAVRGLLASTGIGLLVVGVGYLAEKMLNLADNTDKATGAAKRYKGAGGSGGGNAIGEIAKKYEGGELTSFSDNPEDPGGKSYGPYQFTAGGSMKGFIQYLIDNDYEAGNFLRYRDASLGGGEIDTESEEFHARWLEAVEKYENSIMKPIDKYAKTMFYDELKSGLGDFNPDTHSSALQQAIMSTAIQHGPYANNGFGGLDIVREALSGADNKSDSDIINAIYAIRTDRIRRDGGIGEDTKQNIINNRYPNELNDLLSQNPDANTTGKVDTSGLELQQKKQETEELARAQMAYNQAVTQGVTEQYIADLDTSDTRAKQDYDLGKIGIAEYDAKIRENLIARTNANIQQLIEQVKAQEAIQGNLNLSSADKVTAQTKIVELNAQIAVQKKKLNEALNTNFFEEQQAMTEEIDKANSIWAELLTIQGKLVEAETLKQKNANTQLEIAKLRADNLPDAANAKEKVLKSNVITAQVSEASTHISNVQEDMTRTEGALIRSVIDGNTTIADALAQYKNDYLVNTAADLEKLKTSLTDAQDIGWETEVRKIDEIIRGMKKYIGDFAVTLTESLDTDLQNKLQKIDTNLDLTTMQKEQATSDAKLATARQKLAVAQSEGGGVPNAKQQETINTLEAQITQMERLADTTDRVGVAAKQSFEDGLLTFLSDGITKCDSLGEAFLNLANTVLSAIQKIYAEAITKNIMSALGLGSTGSNGSSGSSTYSFPTSIDITKPLTFAEGGEIEAGKVKGPGTSTSDSILAYVSNLGSMIRISNGEGVLTGKAMQNIGTNALDALNRGVDPRLIFKGFANGGSLTSNSIPAMTGPQDVAASLTSGDTNVHLKNVNLFDMNQIGDYIQSRNGEKVFLNLMKNNATTYSQVLKFRG